MLKVLLCVDGSPSAIRATGNLIATLGWYKEQPRIDLLAVHLPVPRFPHMGTVISAAVIEAYYDEESQEMLAPSIKALDAAGVKYVAHKLVGPIAESIAKHAQQCGSDVLYMGTRGMSALANMALGSVATKVLHLAHIPVVLIH